MMKRATSLVALLALLALATAELSFAPGSESTVMFAETEAYVYVLSSEPPTVAPASLFTAAVSEGSSGNYTITLSSKGGVGTNELVVSSSEGSITGSVVVAGVAILSDGVVISGDDGEGASIGSSGTKSYEYKAVDVDGSVITVSSATVTSTSNYDQIDLSSTGFSSTNFVIHINDNRYGSSSFMLDIVVVAIVNDGEAFETSLKISQDVPSPPPCVVVGGEYPIENGKVTLKMYNLGAPPRESDVSSVVLKVGSTPYGWDPESSLDVVPQMITFSVSSSGSASVTCDGAEAIVSGDGALVITGTPSTPSTPSTPELASDMVDENDPKSVEGYELLECNLRVVDSSVATLTMADANAIINKVCSVISAYNNICVLSSLTEGSAIMEVKGNVESGSNADDALNECFNDCTCQEDLGYECDKLTLESVSTNAAPGPAAATPGLALWTIILIAALGAFALITLIMLGLLAVYRRSAGQSESGYSSSGPLGVPDPSDLLYEQSIVRDIYGRGDFPDGGPSVAVAEQRQREANLREEFPRPPTSTSLSRDDASSTYTL